MLPYHLWQILPTANFCWYLVGGYSEMQSVIQFNQQFLGEVGNHVLLVCCWSFRQYIGLVSCCRFSVTCIFHFPSGFLLLFLFTFIEFGTLRLKGCELSLRIVIIVNNVTF